MKNRYFCIIINRNRIHITEWIAQNNSFVRICARNNRRLNNKKKRRRCRTVQATENWSPIKRNIFFEARYYVCGMCVMCMYGDAFLCSIYSSILEMITSWYGWSNYQYTSNVKQRDELCANACARDALLGSDHSITIAWMMSPSLKSCWLSFLCFSSKKVQDNLKEIFSFLESRRENGRLVIDFVN